jgi:hypothetical protein
MKNLFTFLIGICIYSNVEAQTPQLNWSKLFNGKGASTDSTSKMKMNVLDKSIYIVGTSDAYGTGNDIVLIKRDFTTGDTLWTRHYSGPANSDDQAVDLVINQNTGDIFITGKSTGLSTAYDIVTLKYSSTGTFGWEKRWDNQDLHGDDIPKSIGIDVNGRIIISATTYNGTSNFDDLLVLDYDAFGGLTNYNTYDLFMNFYPRSIDLGKFAKVSNNGEVFIAGECMRGSLNNGYSIVFSLGLNASLGRYYNTSCTSQLYLFNSFGASTYSSPDDFNYFNAMDLDNSNNIYVAYQNDTISGVGYGYAIGISKTNALGCTVWNKRFGSNSNSKNLKANAIKVDTNGNVYAVGYEMNIDGNLDWFIIKYSSEGVIQWKVTKKGNGNGNDLAYDIAFDYFQNPIVVGITYNLVTKNDITTAKFNKTNGTELFSINYDSSNGDEKAYNIFVDASQNIIINGILNSVSQSQNMITLMYCNSVGDAGLISGLSSVCMGQNSVVYTVPEIDNATSYIWTLPIGATGTSTTNSISVNYGSSAISGDITVKGHNDCFNGAPYVLPITVKIKPLTPIIDLNGKILHSNFLSGNQWYYKDGLILNATNQDYTVTENGVYYVIVTTNGCSSDKSNSINYVSTGREISGVKNNIKVYPNPISNELIMEKIGNTTPINFKILNPIGQIVLDGSLTEKVVIQTSNFSLGVYLIKFENGKSYEFKKIIKE